MLSRQQKRAGKQDLHYINENGMVACNPRDKEAAHRADVERVGTENKNAVTCKKCLEIIRKLKNQCDRKWYGNMTLTITIMLTPCSVRTGYEQSLGGTVPITFHIDKNIGIFKTEGDVDYREGIKILQGGLQDIKSSIDFPLILFDIRKSKEDRDSDEIRGIAQILVDYFEDAKVALLVEGDLYFGLSRMFEAYMQPSNIQSRVFKNYDDALSWLKE